MPAAWRTSSSDRPSLSFSFCAAAGVSVPDNMRLPGQPMPKRVGSSAVNTRSSMECRGRNPASCSARMASKPAEHADHAIVFAGVRNGVDVRAGADGGSVGIGSDASGRKCCRWRPAERERPAASQRFFSQARAFRSVGVKTMRVTTGGSASEMEASSSISDDRRSLIEWRMFRIASQFSMRLCQFRPAGKLFLVGAGFAQSFFLVDGQHEMVFHQQLSRQ